MNWIVSSFCFSVQAERSIPCLLLESVIQIRALVGFMVIKWERLTELCFQLLTHIQQLQQHKFAAWRKLSHVPLGMSELEACLLLGSTMVIFRTDWKIWLKNQKILFIKHSAKELFCRTTAFKLLFNFTKYKPCSFWHKTILFTSTHPKILFHRL